MTVFYCSPQNDPPLLYMLITSQFTKYFRIDFQFSPSLLSLIRNKLLNRILWVLTLHPKQWKRSCSGLLLPHATRHMRSIPDLPGWLCTEPVKSLYLFILLWTCGRAIMKLGSYHPTDYPQVLVSTPKDISGQQLRTERWGEVKMCPTDHSTITIFSPTVQIFWPADMAYNLESWT